MQSQRISVHRNVVVGAIVLCIALPGSVSPVAAEVPVGRAFTYQGNLLQGGNPVDEICEFQFSLWDDPLDTDPSARVGSTQLETVDVSVGGFSAVLDFGADIFTGNARWLESAVCCPSPCGDFTTLEPRQELTPAPYSLRASNGVGGPEALNVNAAGNVGIGTNAPEQKLHVVSGGGIAILGQNTATTGARYGLRGESDSDEGRGLFGWAKSATGRTWGVVGRSDSDTGEGVFGLAMAASGTNYGVRGATNSPVGFAGYFTGGRNYFEGNVGIGTEVPTAGLHVQATGIVLGVSRPADMWRDNFLSIDPGTHLGSMGAWRAGLSWNGYRAASPNNSWTVEGINDFTTSGHIGIGNLGILFSMEDYGGVGNFPAGPTLRMLIAPDGNVGIGTSDPDTRLHVYGDQATITLQDNADPGSQTRIVDVTPTQLVINKDTASGGSLIDVSPNPLDGSSFAKFRLFRSTNTTGVKEALFLRGNNTPEVSALIGVDGRDSFFQAHGGNLGIGTTIPDAKLHIAGTTGVDGVMFPDGTLQTTAFTGGGDGNTLDQAYDQGGPGAGRTIYATDGAVNIAGFDGLAVSVAENADGPGLKVARTTSSFPLTNVWTQIDADTINAYSRSLITVGSSLRLNHESSGDVLLAEGGGNVGIGTSTPGRRLQVGDNTTADSEGMIRLASRSGTQGSNRIWDIGVPETDADSSGIGYSFVIDDTQSGTDPEFIVKFGSGNVGIGTVNPKQSLHNTGDYYGRGHFWLYAYGGDGLDGDAYIQARDDSGTSSIGLRLRTQNAGSIVEAMSLTPDGTTRVRILEITGADVAEKFPVSEEVKPGMVVEIDPDHAGQLRIARGAYNRRVAGVVSGANDLSVGVILGNLPGQEDAPPIAMSGRVWTMCNASNGPIAPGDLLTTSDTPGHAIKVTDYTRAQGAIIGKAMTFLSEGKGLVLVLVSLQ